MDREMVGYTECLWLCKAIFVNPETLTQKASSVNDLEYHGELSIYCCSMLVHALANNFVLFRS